MWIDELRVGHKDQVVRCCIVGPFFPVAPVACSNVRVEGRAFAAVYCVEPYQDEACAQPGEVAEERVSSRDLASGLGHIVPGSHA